MTDKNLSGPPELARLAERACGREYEHILHSITAAYARGDLDADGIKALAFEATRRIQNAQVWLRAIGDLCEPGVTRNERLERTPWPQEPLESVLAGLCATRQVDR